MKHLERKTTLEHPVAKLLVGDERHPLPGRFSIQLDDQINQIKRREREGTKTFSLRSIQKHWINLDFSMKH